MVEMRGEERRGEERSDRRSRTTMVVAGPPGAMVRSRRDSNEQDQRTSKLMRVWRFKMAEKRRRMLLGEESALSWRNLGT